MRKTLPPKSEAAATNMIGSHVVDGIGPSIWINGKTQ
jgi:hypothetical protein